MLYCRRRHDGRSRAARTRPLPDQQARPVRGLGRAVVRAGRRGGARGACGHPRRALSRTSPTSRRLWHATFRAKKRAGSSSVLAQVSIGSPITPGRARWRRSLLAPSTSPTWVRARRSTPTPSSRGEEVRIVAGAVNGGSALVVQPGRRTACARRFPRQDDRNSSARQHSGRGRARLAHRRRPAHHAYRAAMRR